MNVYDLNKSSMSALPDLTATGKKQREGIIKDFFHNKDADYYMMLCRERNDYTLFYDLHYEDSVSKLIEEIFLCLDNRGNIKEIQLDEQGSAIELWVSTEEDTYCYFFFPYDEGVIKA